jgi:iron complex transport system ATP-binding protein
VLSADLNISLKKGRVVGLLGPNGSGKSTLLRTLAGLQPALSGTVTVMGQPVKSNQVRQTARVLSVVLTGRIDVRNLTVLQLVAMGRYPYNNWLGRLGEDDRKMIRQSLEWTYLWDLRNQMVNEMSDGEQQRALFAKALAQDTPLIILDEPTAHLDLPNRVSMMQLLRKLATETGKSILFSSHDLDLALQVADELWLLKRGGTLITGSPGELCEGTVFEDVFYSGAPVSGENFLNVYFQRLRSQPPSK